jgi:hypothetical protein
VNQYGITIKYDLDTRWPYYDYQYFYFKIYFKEGSIGILIIEMILRAIILFLNFTIIIIIVISVINTCGSGVGLFKKVVYFIRNKDGTITFLKDITIKEVNEGNSGNGGVILERVCNKKIDENQINCHVPIRENNLYTNNNGNDIQYNNLDNIINIPNNAIYNHQINTIQYYNDSNQTNNNYNNNQIIISNNNLINNNQYINSNNNLNRNQYMNSNNNELLYFNFSNNIQRNKK